MPRRDAAEQQGAIETFLGAHDLSKHYLDHSAIAERIGVVRLDLDCALVQFERLFVLPQMHQRIAEVGQRDHEIRLQRDGPLLTPPRLLEITEVEVHGRQVVMGVMQARIERNHALEQLPGLLQAAAVMRTHPEQVQGVDMIRKRFQDLTA